MSKIKIELVQTLEFYKKALKEKVTSDQFRYEVMQPISSMWSYLNTPMKAKEVGGYDVLMAAEMLGIWTPRIPCPNLEQQLKQLKETTIFTEYQEVISKGLQQFSDLDYEIPLEKIVVNILLGDGNNQLLMSNEGYSGFGGIPGYILLIVVPNDFNQHRLQSALAHELNHNIRFTYVPFQHGDVSVEEYVVIEGLAEVFAESLYGKDCRGPWVQDYDEEELAYTLAVFKEARHVKGFEQVAAYMYGDEVARSQGYQPVGVSKNAGYTIGYQLVKAYLANTGQTIAQATLTPTESIISKSNFFD